MTHLYLSRSSLPFLQSSPISEMRADSEVTKVQPHPVHFACRKISNRFIKMKSCNVIGLLCFLETVCTGFYNYTRKQSFWGDTLNTYEEELVTGFAKVCEVYGARYLCKFLK